MQIPKRFDSKCWGVTCCESKGWELKHMIKDRSVVARRLFDALCAKYPDKYVTLIQRAM
jgi:hypothetical protein